MPNKKNVSRRHFLQSAGSLSGIAYLRLSGAGFAAIAQAACSAKHDSAAYLVLGDDEAADFAAIAARIIPTTDTPGATEAGVIHFFDQAFAGEMSDQLDAARAGLADFNAAIADTAAPAARFSALGTDEQEYSSTTTAAWGLASRFRTRFSCIASRRLGFSSMTE